MKAPRNILFPAGSIPGSIAIALGVLLGSGCSQPEAIEEVPEKPVNVRVLEVEPTDLNEYLEVAGRLRPVRGTDISTEESGTVARLPVAKGVVVDRGDAVVELDRRILKAEMDAAEAARVLREFNEERTRALFDENSVSGQEMLVAHTEHERAKAEAEIARLRYERAAIESPFPGVVTDRYVELGQLVTAGQPVARIVDPFHLILEGSVTEREVSAIDEDAPVLVAAQGAGGVIEATVSWVSLEADPATGKFPIEIRVENERSRLRPGTIARARIRRQAHEDVIAIPRDAVVQKPSRQVVFVVEGERAVERRVRLGADQGVMVLAEEGVELGELLVVRGQRDLRDDSLVAIRERATAPDGSIPEDPDEIRPDRALDDFTGDPLGGPDTPGDGLR